LEQIKLHVPPRRLVLLVLPSDLPNPADLPKPRMKADSSHGAKPPPLPPSYAIFVKKSSRLLPKPLPPAEEMQANAELNVVVFADDWSSQALPCTFNGLKDFVHSRWNTRTNDVQPLQ
ncbi:MAG TPA: hypothetical protein VK968_04990, partial [Roseimicrobium sp.]|nr:hypothetical protein [Roseimicrobium sp.]